MTRLVLLAIPLTLTACTWPPPVDSLVNNEPPATCLDTTSCMQIGSPVSVIADPEAPLRPVVQRSCVNPEGFAFRYEGFFDTMPVACLKGRK